MIIAIDPGRDKCGLAVLAEDGAVQSKRIVPRGVIVAEVSALAHPTVVIGDSAAGRLLKKELELSGQSSAVVLADERNSTLEARQLFWQENRPRGLWRLLPASLRPLPRPIDDWAAVVIGQRYLGVEHPRPLRR